MELTYKCPIRDNESCLHSDEDDLENEDDDDEPAFVPPPLPTQNASANLAYPHGSEEKISVPHQPMEMRGDGLGGYSSGEDSRALLSLEQNIANLEKSIRRSGGGSTSKLNSIGMERGIQVRFAGGKRSARENYIENVTDGEGDLTHMTRSTSLDITTEGGMPKRRHKGFQLPSTVKKRLVFGLSVHILPTRDNT